MLKEGKYASLHDQDESNPMVALSDNKPIEMAPIKELFRYSTKSDKFLFITSLVFSMLLACCPIYFVFAFGDIIDTMDDFDGDKEHYYHEERKLAYRSYVVGACAIFFGWGCVYCFVKFGCNQGIAWRRAYFGKVINQPIKWFDKNNQSELSTQIDIDCNAIQQSMGEKTLLIFYSLYLFFVGWTICIAFFNPILSLFQIGMFPLQFLGAGIIEKSMNQAEELSQARYKTAGGIAEESLEGIKTIASCNAQESRAKRYQEELEPLKGMTTEVGFLTGLGWSLFFIVLFFYSGLTFYVGSLFMENHPHILGIRTDASPKDIIRIYFALSFSTFYLGAAAPCIQYVNACRMSLKRIIGIIDKEDTKAKGDKQATSISGVIEFKEVMFGYPTDKTKIILNGISFKIDAGVCMAVVGETGSGKSTIIQLIEGFYHPRNGTVTIDGVNIEKYDLKSLREHISLVGQEPILFNCSIRDNIKLGKLNSSQEDIILAAKEAEAHTFIEGLPDKYDTWVGIKGSQLSGGQKQRIAIARALIRRPKILLLDEATSALDTKTEKKIQETLDKIMRTRTTVIVAQRLSTIRSADRILVLKDGVVAEEGTFDQLIRAEGVFSRLINIQKKADEKSLKSLRSFKSVKDSKGKPADKEEKIHVSEKDVWNHIFKLLREFWHWMLLILILAIVTGATFPVYGYLFADSINNVLGLNGDDITHETRSELVYFGIISITILFSLTLMCYALSKVSALTAYKVRYDSFLALMYFDQKYFERPENSPAGLSTRLGVDCDNLSRVGGPALGIQLFLLTGVIVAVIWGMTYNVILSLLVLATLPLSWFSLIKAETLIVKGIVIANLKKTTEIASDSLSNIKTVHSMNIQDYFLKEYIKAGEEENENIRKGSHTSGVLFGYRITSLLLVWGTAALSGGYMVKENNIEIDEQNYVLFTLIFSTFGMIAAGAMATDVNEGIASGQRLFTMIEYEPEIDGKSLLGIKDPIQGAIEFKQVSFTYENRDIIVLNGVSFSIQPGQRLGITGTTGSGKSTIGQLLFRFYNPVSGEILIDSRPIASYNIAYLRDSICWVSQEPILFRGGIEYNLQIGNQNSTETERENALRMAQAMDIVEKYGLNGDVGVRGSILSGGQKQRIAIARALVRKPKILIFDESTSALDSATEANLMHAIRDLPMTIVAVAHKLKTIENFDKIVLLEKGVIVESGTHDDLINIPDGFYSKLYNAS